MRRRIHRVVSREVSQTHDLVTITQRLDCGHVRIEYVREKRATALTVTGFPKLARRLKQLDRRRPLACFTCLDGTTSALVEPGV